MLELIWYNSMDLPSLALTAISILFSGLALQPFLLGNVSDANPAIFTATPPALISPTGRGLVDLGAESVVSSTYTNNDAIHDWAGYYIVEVRASDGRTILLDFQSGIVDAGGRVQVGVRWTPLQADSYELRTFAISDLTNPQILSQLSTSYVEIAEANSENLALFSISETDLSIEETYGTIYYLANNGENPVALTIDDDIGVYESLSGRTQHRFGPDASCLWKDASKIDHPDAILKPGEMMNLTKRNSQSVAPNFPGVYYNNPFVIVSVQAQDRVKCLEIVGDTVTLDVTGPVNEDVKVVLESDKTEYAADDVVHFSFFVENSSDEPFTFNVDDPVFEIRSSKGPGLMQLALEADDTEPITVEPHSRYRLDNLVNLDWDLHDVNKIFSSDEDDNVQAAFGDYFVNATCTYPYLESNTLKIRAIE